jgi:hypothetical protein
LTNILSANVVSPLVKAFPNPTNGIILIEFYEVDKINKIEYTINDGECRFLEKRNSPVINTRSVELNFHDFKNGIYFVNIVLNNKTRISVKVVKY